MEKPRARMTLQGALIRLGRGAAVFVIAIAALDWLGWATGAEVLTRTYRTWPQMTPWTALWLAMLACAFLLQTGLPSRGRVWAARGLAIAVGVVAVAILAEYATAWTPQLDQVWFTDALQRLQVPWPGRPSPQTAGSALLLAVAAGLARVEQRWTTPVWTVCLLGTAAIAGISLVAYLFGATELVRWTPSTDMAVSTAFALLLLVVAASAVRTDRPPLVWFVARHDGGALLRLDGLAVAFMVLLALSRLAFLTLGATDNEAFALAVVLCTALTVVVGLRLRRQEQDLLIEKEQLARERADAEARYRILADNAVDVIVHLRDTQIAWISPSVESALGAPPQAWIGAAIGSRIHPDDLETVADALERITRGNAVIQRFRVLGEDGVYHWVDGHGKPYVDADGNTDGLIAALRIVDDRVEVEQQLEKLARFDTLTGLANRAEAIARLESALEHPPALGMHLGILFCDVDHFKDINDTWGHAAGDLVLATLAARVRESVRPETPWAAPVATRSSWCCPVSEAATNSPS